MSDPNTPSWLTTESAAPVENTQVAATPSPALAPANIEPGNSNRSGKDAEEPVRAL